MSKLFEILFKEPIKIVAETPGEAVLKFAEMIDKEMDLNAFFYATEKTEVERNQEELAEFFMENYLEEIIGDSEDIFDEDVKDIAWRGVQYWYSGNVDGTQYDCLILGLEDWKRENGYR